LKLDELANSIKELGLIEPLVIEMREGRPTLLAGERRLRACKMLGMEEVDCVLKENLDDWHRLAIEIEENVKRENLTYDEQVEGYLQLHELYQKRFGPSQERKKGGWGVNDTAELLGLSHGQMTEDLILAKALRVDPSLKEKDGKKAAYKALQVRAELSLKKGIAEVLSEALLEQGEEPIQILNGDSLTILKTYPDESFDFCITDPPYGIGLHDMQQIIPQRGDSRQGEAGAHQGVEFNDSIHSLKETLPIFKELFRVLREGSHCYVFFAIARLAETKEILEEAGFWIQPTPLFWIKNNALNLRPHICFPVNYEPIFYCSKGYPPRPFPEIPQSSTFDYPTLSGREKTHPAEKSVPLIKRLIEYCSQPKERGVDPFLGSGATMIACHEMGRLGVGIELDKVWWLEATQRLMDAKGGTSP